jgi:hypothetical protein
MLAIITSDTFGQLRYIIDQLTPTQYQEKYDLLNGSSLGQHIRHVLEFYTCLADGMDTGVVDYDKRKRNLKIETDPNYAQVVLDGLMAKFCCPHLDDMILSNCIEYNGVVIHTKSSLSRELVYLIEHSIHHFAIMQIAIKNCCGGVNIPASFGVAYSTTKHKESQYQEIEN